MITSNPLYKTLKPTLDNLSTDDLERLQVCIGKGKLVTFEKMKDGYADDLETAGTTLLVRKAEGAPMATDEITVGGTKRYLPKTMAKKVSISEEALEDCKYASDVLQPAKRLLASAYRTQDVDVASIIINSVNTAYTGGYDAVVLASSSHKLPSGGTYSNILPTYSTPSIPALMLAKANLRLMKQPNGLITPLTPKAIVCPEIQADVWETILGSDKVTGSNWNDLNIVRSYKLKVMPIYHLDAPSATQWGLTTDAENGFRALEKRKITQNTWTDNDATVMHYGITYRMAVGWSNARCWYQGNV